MKKPSLSLKALFLGFTLFILILPVQGISEPDAEAIRSEINALQDKLEGIIKTREAEREQARDQEEKLETEIQTMQESLGGLKAKETGLEQRISELSREAREINRRISERSMALGRIEEILIREARLHKSRIESGLPYNRELRMSDFSLMEKDLSGRRITPREGLERIFALLEQEKYLTGENELYFGALPRDQRGIREVRFLRLGMISLAYVSSDDKEAGIWEEESWNEELPSALRRSLRQAVHILEGKEKFVLVEYPFNLKNLSTQQ